MARVSVRVRPPAFPLSLSIYILVGMQQAETTLSRITMVLGPVVLDLKAPPRIRDGSLGERRNDVVRHRRLLHKTRKEWRYRTNAGLSPGAI